MNMLSSWDTGKDLFSRDWAVRFARSAMPDLVRQACKEGWQTQLIGFIQRQHHKPTSSQVQTLIADQNEIDFRLSQMSPEMRVRWKYDDILAKRAQLREELTNPIKVKVEG